MMTEWAYLRKELDRVEGRVMDFGWFAGWRVEQVNRVNRSYLFWCLEAVPMRAELRRTILRVLVYGTRGGHKPGRHDTAVADEQHKTAFSSSSDPPGTLSATP